MSDIHRLRTLADESRDFNSFQSNIGKNSENIIAYVNILQCIIELQEEKEKLLIDLEQKSYWISDLIYVEINMMYEIYYGQDQIRRYYDPVNYPLSSELLRHLYKYYPDYYERLRKRGVVKNDVPL